MLKELKRENLLTSVSSIDQLKSGAVLLWEESGSVRFARYWGRNQNGLILENVINLSENEFLMQNTVMKNGSQYRFYCFDSDFGNNDESRRVLKIVQKWALFDKYPQLKQKIVEFVINTYPPSLVIFLEERDRLMHLFVPIQQKFKIGRFTEKQKWEDVNIEKFQSRLESLIPNEYITYMGYLPQTKNTKPMFYSLGTETHLETDNYLKKEPFLYNSNCGGNIKLVKAGETDKVFAVDAGSSYKGNGVKTSIEDAKAISAHLKSIFPNYKFIPVEGRGAIGSRHSF